MGEDLVVGCARSISISKNAQKHPKSTRPICANLTKVKKLKKNLKESIDKCNRLWQNVYVLKREAQKINKKR